MTITPKRNQFIVRALRDKSELSRCLELDHTYATEYVWQMDMREEHDDTVVRFRSVRLPRMMQVEYPRDSQSQVTSWQTCDCFLVAQADDVILGYVNMHIDAERITGWIHDLVVHQPFRRQRIGSALLEQAARWGRLHNIQRLTIDMQTKNCPAINFAKIHGFVFCGFNDHYYPNQDIAVFFVKNL